MPRTLASGKSMGDETDPARRFASAIGKWGSLERRPSMREGMSVVGLDGEEIGEVSGTDGEFLLVKAGGAFGSELQVPRSAVARDDGETVRLNVTKEDAVDGRWPGTPAGEAI